MTTKTMTRKTAFDQHAEAVKKADAAAKLLEAAQKSHAELLAATNAALDDPDTITKLAEEQARVGHLVETHEDMLTAAHQRVREAGFAVLPFIAADYRKTETEARDWITAHDTRTDELLNALCEHTESDAWQRGALGTDGRVGGRAPGPKKREKIDEAWRAGRAARFIELVLEGREHELVDELDRTHQKKLRHLLGDHYTGHPLQLGFAQRTTRAALPPELKPGGIYPLWQD